MSLSTNAHDAPQLAVALQRAQERIRQLEQENNELRNEIRWIDKLLAVPASIMSPSHKVTLRAAVKAYQRGTPEENGLVQIESWKLCKTVGQSKQTFLDNLTYCTEKLGILTKKRERIIDSDTNDYTTNLYIGVTPLLAHPHQYKVEQPRNHGGERQLCPHCQSDRLQRKVTITCMNCGSVLDEKISLVNQGSHLDVLVNRQDDNAEETQESEQPKNVNLTTDITSHFERQVDVSEEITFQEPTTPQVSADVDEMCQDKREPQATPADHTDQSQAQSIDQVDVLTRTATLLLDVAGPEPVHIEMSSRGPKKYYDVRRAITEQDTRAHLLGEKTKGAYVRHAYGMTRALCYDADTEQDWEHLLDGARFLAEAGYRPIVEDSPVGRGGHLWVIFTNLVKASWAHQHVLQVAPMLQHIREYWPGPGSNKVRLPGGKYVKPGFSQWCKLHDARGARLAEDGLSAARVLLDYQTPAEIVPAYPEPETVEQPSKFTSIPNNDDQAHTRKENSIMQAESWVDHRWQQKYGRYLWFQFTPAQLAAWYNERNRVQDIRPPEKNGMGLATWRGERTASVGLREDGWVDFGASARRSDGKQDGGDALELAVRVTEEAKAEVMREIAQQLVHEARAAMESAALNGEQPPQWVQAFMSPAGWERYHQLRNEVCANQTATLDGSQETLPSRGVAGFHTPQERTPTSTEHTSQEHGQRRDSAPVVPVRSSSVPDTPEALASDIGATIGEPCRRCGCTLRYLSGPYVMCYKCHPRKLSDEQWARLRALFPRKLSMQLS